MKKAGNQSKINMFQLTLGALYVALFALAGNIPILSAIQIIPGVPITLQVFLVAMMGLTLGVKGGCMSLLSVLVLTACGLPMMAGGKGGPAVFYGPTCGYIYGWFFIILLTGLYASHFMDKLIRKTLVKSADGTDKSGIWAVIRRKLMGISIHIPVCFLVGMLGVLLDYLCGSVALAAISGQSITQIPALLLSNLAFLPGDMVKIGLATAMSLSLFTAPAFYRLFDARKVRS